MGMTAARWRMLATVLLFVSLAGLLMVGRYSARVTKSLMTAKNGFVQYVRGPGMTADPPPEQPPYGAVVAAGRANTDLSWMHEPSFQKSWTIYPYNVDDPSSSRDARLRIPQNKGHEAMVYLSYIIDNYDTLTWMTLFIHGHNTSWHQPSPIATLIESLNRTAVAQQGYISLHCSWYPSCPAEIRPVDHDAIKWGPGINRTETEFAIQQNWRMIFGTGEVLPETIASPCCAQFAVTRELIRRRKRAAYEQMRAWLIDTQLADDAISGRVFEKLWAYIFTGQAVYCPPPDQCACEFFGRCDEVVDWPQPPAGLRQIPKWP